MHFFNITILFLIMTTLVIHCVFVNHIHLYLCCSLLAGDSDELSKKFLQASILSGVSIFTLIMFQSLVL